MAKVCFNMTQDRLRALPSVTALLEDSRLVALLRGRRRSWLTRLIQEVLGDLRRELLQDQGPFQERDQLLDRAVQEVQRLQAELLQPALRRVLNGTGVVVHTNLGRSNYPASALAAATRAASFNSDLEYDLQAGTRGHRGRKIERKVALLTGAEDALIVNNNAAAVWLGVRYFSSGGPVILSRGEVVAIGGSFRMHEILAETGCRLIEVGTTNRTSLDDYREALEPGATVLKVHRSNFVVEGFTEEVSLAELAALCREGDARLVFDAGSGTLYPFAEFGLPEAETLLTEDLGTGPDLVTCSGDKLLGGPQAGILLGGRRIIDGLRAHPMRRALRVDKTTLAALDAVLNMYLEAEGRPQIPTLDQLAQPLTQLEARAAALLQELKAEAPPGWRGQVVVGQSSVGGGSFSNVTMESRLLLWTGPKAELEACHQLLRLGNPALVGRMNQDGLAVDVRTLIEEELPLVVEAFCRAWNRLVG